MKGFVLQTGETLGHVRRNSFGFLPCAGTLEVGLRDWPGTSLGVTVLTWP